jgi:class 3 adenylate cyclase/tetratricopeptide (TPR) repeat protein
VTVLFADIVGSTSVGEHHDAEAVQAVLSQYFDTAATILRRHGGTVEKFIGDAVVAVFGVPESHEDDALRAVRAAIEFRDSVQTLHFGAQAPLRVRIGVNTGEVVVGDPTTGQTFSVGDAMNTAARLEQAAQAGQILMGELTRRLVGDAVDAEAIGGITAKGKHDAVAAWVVNGVAVEAADRSRRSDTPLVGRDAERARLESALADVAAQGHCRVVTLLGDAGVGKSALAGDFAAAHDDGALHGRCLSYGEGVTFWPLIEVLRGALGGEDAAPDDLAPRLVALLGEDSAAEQVTQRLLDILQGAGTANTQESFWAVRRFLEAAAGSAPLVLLIDDIHWAEPTFLDLLEYLATWTRAPLLVLCTARPDLLDARPDWAGGLNVEVLELRPLTADQARELAGTLLATVSLPEAVAARVAAASEGNPLYVEEMLRMLLDEQGSAAGERMASRLEQLAVPPTVQALIAARLDRLEEGARALLQRAAVVGAEFSGPALRAVAPDDGDADLMAGLLRTLVHREFVVPQPQAGEEAYRFGHGLVRDVAYAATPKRDRAELHARLATWLEEAAASEGVEYNEIVGHHLGQAATLRIQLGILDAQTHQLAARACELLTVAGRRALARSDMPAAAKLLRRAASLSLEDQSRTAQLQLELCDALIEMGELAEVERLVPEISAAATSLEDDRLVARTAVMQAMLDMNLDVEIDRTQIVRAFDRAVTVLSAAGDFVGCSQAYQVLADVHWNDSSFEAAQKDLEAALEFASRADDARERGRIVTWLASALLWGPAHAEEAIARCEQIVAEASGDLLVQGKTRMILAGLYALRGRFDDARRAFAESRRAAEDLGLSLTLASGTQVSGMIEILAGDPVAAEAEFRRGYDALVDMGQKGFLPAAAAFLAGALLDQGRYEEAEALAATLLQSAAPDDVAARGDHDRIASRLAAARGDHATAVALAESAVQAYAGTDELKTHADALRDLATALAAAGDRDRAVATGESARRLYQHKGITPSVDAVEQLLRSLGVTEHERSPSSP